MVLKPELEEQAKAIFTKWGLDFAVIGHTTDTKRYVIKLNGEIKADMPIKEMGDEAPEYDRPYIETPKRPLIDAASVKPPMAITQALIQLIGSPDMCSKRWVWQQYDHLILGNTVQMPGGDAAIIRLEEGPKGLALTCDVTPRYCEADPYEGGKQAVAECWRNLTCVGGLPIALTDNLNFGNPEKPEIMGQLVGCIRGIGEAARRLDFPVVSGNVSLYNETNGQAILPTPTIGGVALLDDVTVHASIAFKAAGEAILVLGATSGWLGSSIYLADICGREEGAPPPVNLEAEKRHGDFVRNLILEGRVSAVHDCSDGGLAIALAEMALAGKIGATLDYLDNSIPAHGFYFGEDQARYVLTCPQSEAKRLIAEAERAGIPASNLGETGGDALTLAGCAPISLLLLENAHETWLPTYMQGKP